MPQKQQKTEAQVAWEKQERARLTDRILTLTGGRIPAKVLNEFSHDGAVQFKEIVLKARKVAGNSKASVGDLQAAWNSISEYYRGMW